MSVELRMSGALYAQMRQDLARPHAHAEERVGFAFGRISAADGHEPIVHLLRYQPVADERYIPSNRFGALIDDVAILEVMQEVRSQRGTGYGAFHVHLHNYPGQPCFSRPDLQSLPQLIPSFRRMDPEGACGLLLISLDHAIANVWLPKKEAGVVASAVSIIGHPLRIFRFRGKP